MLAGRDLPVRLHPRLSGRDEHHLVQMELPQRLLGGDRWP